MNKILSKFTYISILMFFTCTFSANGQYNIGNLLRKCQKELNAKNYTSVIRWANIIINTEKDNTDAFYLRGIAKYNLGDYKGALKDLEVATKTNPFYPYYFYYKGLVHEQLYEYQNAIDCYAKAIELSPDFVYAYLRKGIALIIKEQPEKALEELDIAMRFDRKDENIYLYRAMAYQEVEELDKALNNFDKAIQLNQFEPSFFVRRGMLFAIKKDHKKAIKDYNRALKIDKQYALAYFQRALSKFELIDYVGCLEDYDTVIKLEPENALAWFYRARLKNKVGDYNGALSDLNVVVQLNPENILSWFNRGVVNQILRNHRSAIDDYDQVINLHSEYPDAYYNRGLARQSIGDIAGAMADIEKSKKIYALIDAKPDTVQTADSLQKIVHFNADFSSGNHLAFFRKGKVQYEKTDIYPTENFRLQTRQTGATEKQYYCKYLDNHNAENENIFVIRLQFTPKDTAFVNNENEYSRIQKHLKKQRYSNALEELGKLITKEPENALYYFERANIKYEMLQHYLSINLGTSKVISLIDSPDSKTPPTTNTGMVNIADVVADYEKCITLAPGFFFAYFNLGNVYSNNFEFEKAVSHFSTAIQLNPDFAEAYYNKALINVFTKNNTDACSDFGKAGELGKTEAFRAIKIYCNK